MKAPLIHLASMIFNSPLAIMPEKLEAIIHVVGPRMDVDQSSIDALFQSRILRSSNERTPVLNVTMPVRASWDDDDDDYQSSDKPYKVTKDGIAVINIRGTLVKRGGWLSALSGFSSYDSLSKSVKMAMEDGSVKGLLFDADSPGGTTHGCFECSDLIHSYRGQKPMFGVSNDSAASAAYALLSSCDQIFVTRTGAVGSIGVFALHVDQSAYDEKLGTKFTYIFAGDKKLDGNPHEKLSKNAKGDIQAEVDREYDIFVETIARNRKTSASKVRDTQAGILFADGAIPLLADAVGTYDDALSAVVKKSTSSTVVRISGSAEPDKGIASETILGDNVLAESKSKENEMAAPNFTFNAQDGTYTIDGVTYAKKADADEDASGSGSDKDCPKMSDPDSDGDNDDGDPEDEEDKNDKPATDESKKGESAALAAEGKTEMPETKELTAAEMRDISELCMIAGKPELAADFHTKNTSVADVRKFFRDQRAAASESQNVNAQHNGSGGSNALDTLENQAVALANQKGITKAKAYQQLLAQNPHLYDQYVAEHSANVQSLAGSKTTVSQIAANPYMRGLYSRFADERGGISAGVALKVMPRAKINLTVSAGFAQ